MSVTITSLPTNSNPSTSDYIVTDNGTTTSKTPIKNLPVFGLDSISSVTDANNTELIGRIFSSGANCANLPSDNEGAYFEVLFFGNQQIAIRYTGAGQSEIWSRIYTNSQWYPWVMLGQPRHSFNIGTTPTTITIPINYRGRLSIITTSGASCGEYFIYSTGAGAVGYKAVLETTTTTFATDTNALTLTTASGTRQCVLEDFAGIASL